MQLKIFPLAALLVAASFGVAHAGPVRKIVPKGAVSFSSKAHGFAMWLPDKPTLSGQVAPDANGKITSACFFIVSTSKSAPYGYIVRAFPKPSEILGKPLKRLADMEWDWAEDAKVQKREEIQLNNFRGRELKISWDGGAYMIRNRYFSTPRFFYEISVTGPKLASRQKAAQIDKVFDSFRILPQ